MSPEIRPDAVPTHMRLRLPEGMPPAQYEHLVATLGDMGIQITKLRYGMHRGATVEQPEGSALSPMEEGTDTAPVAQLPPEPQPTSVSAPSARLERPRSEPRQPEELPSSDKVQFNAASLTGDFLTDFAAKNGFRADLASQTWKAIVAFLNEREMRAEYLSRPANEVNPSIHAKIAAQQDIPLRLGVTKIGEDETEFIDGSALYPILKDLPKIRGAALIPGLGPRTVVFLKAVLAQKLDPQEYPPL